MENKLFDDYLYYVKVYEDGEIYEYEFGNMKHAKELYDDEKSKGNKVELFRYKDGKYQRYQAKPCNCAKCAPKKIQYMPHKAN